MKEKSPSTDETPSEHTIAERLARLRDANHAPQNKNSKTSALPTSKTETPDDLMKRLADEVKLDAAAGPQSDKNAVDQLAERLRKLRGGDVAACGEKNAAMEQTDEEDEEEAARKVAARVRLEN